jgi:hypothetical protein
MKSLFVVTLIVSSFGVVLGLEDCKHIYTNGIAAFKPSIGYVTDTIEFPCNGQQNEANCATDMEPTVKLTNFNAFGKMKLYSDQETNIAPLIYLAPQRKYGSTGCTYDFAAARDANTGLSYYHVGLCLVDGPGNFHFGAGLSIQSFKKDGAPLLWPATITVGAATGTAAGLQHTYLPVGPAGFEATSSSETCPAAFTTSLVSDSYDCVFAPLDQFDQSSIRIIRSDSGLGGHDIQLKMVLIETVNADDPTGAPQSRALFSKGHLDMDPTLNTQVLTRREIETQRTFLTHFNGLYVYLDPNTGDRRVRVSVDTNKFDTSADTTRELAVSNVYFGKCDTFTFQDQLVGGGASQFDTLDRITNTGVPAPGGNHGNTKCYADFDGDKSTAVSTLTRKTLFDAGGVDATYTPPFDGIWTLTPATCDSELSDDQTAHSDDLCTHITGETSTDEKVRAVFGDRCYRTCESICTTTDPGATYLARLGDICDPTATVQDFCGMVGGAGVCQAGGRGDKNICVDHSECGAAPGVEACKAETECDQRKTFRWTADTTVSELRRSCEGTTTRAVGLQAPGTCDEKDADGNALGGNFCQSGPSKWSHCNPATPGACDENAYCFGAFDNLGTVACDAYTTTITCVAAGGDCVWIPDKHGNECGTMACRTSQGCRPQKQGTCRFSEGVCFNDATCQGRGHPDLPSNHAMRRLAANSEDRCDYARDMTCAGGSEEDGIAEQFPAERTSFYVSHQVVRPTYTLDDLNDNTWKECSSTKSQRCGSDGDCPVTETCVEGDLVADCVDQEYALVYNRYLRALVAGTFKQKVDFTVSSVDLVPCDGTSDRDDDGKQSYSTYPNGQNDGCTSRGYNQLTGTEARCFEENNGPIIKDVAGASVACNTNGNCPTPTDVCAATDQNQSPLPSNGQPFECLKGGYKLEVKLKISFPIDLGEVLPYVGISKALFVDARAESVDTTIVSGLPTSASPIVGRDLAGTDDGTWAFNDYGFGAERVDKTTAELTQTEHRTTQELTITTDCIDIAYAPGNTDSSCAADAFLRRGNDFSLQFLFSACNKVGCLAGDSSDDNGCVCVPLRTDHDLAAEHRGLEFPGGSRYFPLRVSIDHSECPSTYTGAKEEILNVDHAGTLRIHADTYGAERAAGDRKVLSRNIIPAPQVGDYTGGVFKTTNADAVQRVITHDTTTRTNVLKNKYGTGQTVVASLESDDAAIRMGFTLWNRRVRLCRFTGAGAKANALAATAQVNANDDFGCDVASLDPNDVFLLVQNGQAVPPPAGKTDYFQVQTCKQLKLRDLVHSIAPGDGSVALDVDVLGYVPDDTQPIGIDDIKPFGLREDGSTVDKTLCPDIDNVAYTSNRVSAAATDAGCGVAELANTPRGCGRGKPGAMFTCEWELNVGDVGGTENKAAWDAVSFVTDYMVQENDESFWVLDMEGILTDCSTVQTGSRRRLRSVKMHTRAVDEDKEEDVASVALVVEPRKFVDKVTYDPANPGATPVDGADGLDDMDQMKHAVQDGPKPEPIVDSANKWQTAGIIMGATGGVLVLAVGVYLWNRRKRAKAASSVDDMAARYKAPYRPNLLIPRKMIQVN